MRNALRYTCLLAILWLLPAACRQGDDYIVPHTETQVSERLEGDYAGDIKGLFLLNEGNMGSNKCTLDFFSYETGVYYKNIYADRNPMVAKELGDVGNDLQAYGNKLYAVVNCSHFVEVMDINTAKHITQISIPNCRYITFHKGYGYVTSYAGPVQLDPNSRLGYVAKIDTASLQVVDTCNVGYQPEEMVVYQNKLYVANSGGYRFPNYDNRVTVIDLNTFKVIKQIEVAINLHRMEIDRYGKIYVSSRGDYYDVGSEMYVLNAATDRVEGALGLPCSEMAVCGDSLYIYSTEWSYVTYTNRIGYAIYNVKTGQVDSRSFITDGTDAEIDIPYGLIVNPENGDFFITDAKDYVTPGILYCFDKQGKKKWSVTTGDIPAHMTFTYKPLKDIQ